MKTKNKTNKILLIIALAVVVILGGWLVYHFTLGAKPTDQNLSNRNLLQIEALVDSNPQQAGQKLVDLVDPSGSERIILPDSIFYSPKIWWESFIGLFKSSDKKAVYNLHLSRERLIETLALSQKNKDADLQKYLNAYAELTKKIEDKDLSANLVILEQNNALMKVLQLLVPASNKGNHDSLNLAMEKGTKIYQKNVQLKIFSHKETGVKEMEGTVVYNSPYSLSVEGGTNLVIKWQDKNVAVAFSDGLEILDKNGKKLDTLNNIVAGDKLKVKIADSTVNYYKDSREYPVLDQKIKVDAQVKASKINMQ